MNSEIDSKIRERTGVLFEAQQQRIYKHTDRLFAVLMALQWLAGIVAAIWISPKAWAGQDSQIHLHVWAAIFLGGVMAGYPIFLALTQSGKAFTRYVIAIGQVLMSGLLIHLSGGRIETHFHIFGSLAFIAFYRDWRVLIPATIVVASDHWIRGIYWPQSVYGVLTASPWRSVEHAAWVLFENTFLIGACVRSTQEMYEMAQKRAQLETTNEIIEMNVLERTNDLAQTKESLEKEIIERQRLEKVMLQSQKMEAVGSLAGGVAHDFNNLLTVINGYSDLIATKLSPDDPMRPKIEEIRKAGGRAAGLTAQLLAFSRRQVVQKEIVDINAQIVDMDQMLRRLITEQIELVTLQASDLWRIEMDPNQFQQVVMNLVVNARDAMPQGGKITLETQNKVLSKEYVSDQVKIPAGKYVVLVVSDTGCGMSDEVKRRIFEPFFTTKEQGKGTGLGLATCYGIVQQANGYLYVHSVLNQGSNFKVYFPLTESAAALPTGAAEAENHRGTETILLVEDESGLRAFAGELLRNAGYEVLEAENGEEALRLLKESSTKKIHLVLTDVIMPRMGGKELVKQVKSLYPDMKILMMSGYTGSGGGEDEELGVPFLQKPFSLKQLSCKLRDVLEH